MVSCEIDRVGIAGPKSFWVRTITYLGLLVPVTILLSFCTLVFLSLTSPSLSAALAVDKVLLLLVAVSPAAYTAGLTLSVTSLFKSDMKLIACSAVGLNVIMLALLLYFSRAFLMEFRYWGWQ